MARLEGQGWPLEARHRSLEVAAMSGMACMHLGRESKEEPVWGAGCEEEMLMEKKVEGERVQGGGERGGPMLHPQVFDSCWRGKEGDLEKMVGMVEL